jgi:glycerophosphoryl diester phosphodiesterase
VYQARLILSVLSVLAVSLVAGAAEPAAPRLVGHRGLLRHAPENTLAGFAACLELGLGFELDVRRSKDGTLVVMHDADVKRTTSGKGLVAGLTLAELRKLDAGAWFDPAFAGQRVPTLDEVFALVKARRGPGTLVALDIKIQDESVEADLVRLAQQHGVLSNVVCIGHAIDDPAVRRRLRQASSATPVAVLAQSAADLQKALADPDADWAYLRFVPTAEQVAACRKAGKRVFVVGARAGEIDPENRRRLRELGVDAILTDFPLEYRELWRKVR